MKNVMGWLWAVVDYPTLFWAFLRQDLRDRYAGTYGGALWSIATPVANMLIYLFVFSVVLKIRVNIEDAGTDSFVIFFISGLIPWLAFSEALSRAPHVLSSNANLIKKVSFPVEILTFVTVGTSFILNGIALLVFMLYLGVAGYANINWLLLPLLIVIHMLFTQGLVGLAAIFGLFFRDFGNLVTIIIQIWFYATPILYPLSMVPAEYQNIVTLNPIYPFIELYREILLGSELTWHYLLIDCIIAIVTLYLGGRFFMRARDAIGDFV